MSREPQEGLRRHKLLPADVLKALPPLYSQDGKGLDAIAHVKFFCPYSGSATWYITEYDPETGEMFGYFTGWHGDGELSYFDFNELAEARLQRVPMIERDCHWEARPLRECEGVS
jgi:hypothetical protein